LFAFAVDHFQGEVSEYPEEGGVTEGGVHGLGLSADHGQFVNAVLIDGAEGVVEDDVA
jgi:hypothetical protein